MSETPPNTPAPTPQAPPTKGATMGLFLAGIATLALAAIAVVLLAGTRHRAVAEELSARQTELARGPRVRVVEVQEAPATRTVSLPGEVHAWASANLYSKVSGYLQEIHVDKGDWVAKGSLVARIESPEIDQTVHSAEAEVRLRKLTADRLKGLLTSNFVAAQDVDNAEALLKQAEASLASARAMQQYEVIRAPFSGTVTARYADPGALLPAATGSTQAALPVIEISQLDRLRIYIYLGQDEAALVRVGDDVHITMDQRPEVELDARVSRVTHSLDARTRTMLAEVDIDNKATHINPGEFIHATVQLRARPYPMVPVEALIPKSKQFYVAVITDNKAHLVSVGTGHDDGANVQIISGLKGGEMVALNAANDVEEGGAVQAITDEKPKPR
jgi:RND family efflux transporter MFP subunit